MRGKTILVVDDEVHILSALQRALRGEGYELLTADSPLRALDILKVRAVDAILSDHKMPGMSGLELLARAALYCPKAVRLLLTGWTEEISPSQVERLGIRALLPKPWEDAELKAALRAAIEP